MVVVSAVEEEMDSVEVREEVGRRRVVLAGADEERLGFALEDRADEEL